MNSRQRLLAVAALLTATIAGHGHALPARFASSVMPPPGWVPIWTPSPFGAFPATSNPIDAR